MHTTCFPPDHIAVSLHPGRACAEGLVDIDGERDAPVGISKWSQANLQYALHEAVRTGVKARGAGLFTDVDFSTTGGPLVRCYAPRGKRRIHPVGGRKTLRQLQGTLAAVRRHGLEHARIHPRSRRVVSRRNTNLA